MHAATNSLRPPAKLKIKKNAHSVRKIAATTAAENGATEKELDALFGWVDGGRTSSIYSGPKSGASGRPSRPQLDETCHLCPHLRCRCGPQPQKSDDFK
jgi:membrane protein involved in colicin uptake